MAIRGFSINISERLSGKQATTFAQWIGAANVVRNQKIIEYKTLLSEGKGAEIAQAYSHLRKVPELAFLKKTPAQVSVTPPALSTRTLKLPEKRFTSSRRSRDVTRNAAP